MPQSHGVLDAQRASFCEVRHILLGLYLLLTFLEYANSGHKEIKFVHIALFRSNS